MHPLNIFGGFGHAIAETSQRSIDTMVMDKIALVLSIIGGINWGLIGFFRFDLVAYLFGGQTASASRVVYAIIGIAALWCISLLFRDRGEVDET